MNESKVDPITVSVIMHRLNTIAKEMAEITLKTSRSAVSIKHTTFHVELLTLKGE